MIIQIGDIFKDRQFMYKVKSTGIRFESYMCEVYNLDSRLIGYSHESIKTLNRLIKLSSLEKELI